MAKVTEAPADSQDYQRAYEFSAELVTLSEGRPAEAEAIRTMRTHIMARHLEEGRRGVAFCASARGDGCTFSAVNLSVSLAQIGVKTLLIDGDMRGSGVSDFIRPLSLADGLKQYLSARDPYPEDAIQDEVLPNLALLTSGGVADDAQELLGTEPFRHLIERCLRDYEFTVVDTPPANNCADGRRISTLIGYSVLVARKNVSLSRELSALASQIGQDGARVIGTVLNEV